MSIDRKLVNDTYDEAFAKIHNDDLDTRFKKIKNFVYSKTNLTGEEKGEVMKRFDGDYDYFKVIENYGERRICKDCQESCLATLYCECCIRNYLKSNFSNWTSGNNEIDEILRNCQMSSLIPYMIVEWIPYDKFQDIKHLAEGGCSEIYSAIWTEGCYKKWDAQEKKLLRGGSCKVALKRLENVEKANRIWLDEAKAHLYISNKWGSILQCYGLTKNPSDGKFMLVMSHMDIDLRKYILDNRDKLTWKTKIQIIFQIIKAVRRIHDENSVHRDLHSGNVLYSKDKNDWYISDLGFCGPADKPLGSIYGNLPYIAPEVLAKDGYTYKSDIYSIAMIMWELSAERPPFNNLLYNYDLILSITNGFRPQIVSGTPREYRELMKKCWDADPDKRPDIKTLWEIVDGINKSLHEDDSYWNNTASPLNSMFNRDNIAMSSLVEDPYNPRSKIFNFDDLRKTTEEQQEAYLTSQVDLNVPSDASEDDALDGSL